MHNRIRIFVAGIKWPPETFIIRKLKVLSSNKEFEIIVGISPPYKRIDWNFSIPDIRKIKMPHTDDAIIRRFFMLIKYTFLNLRHPYTLFMTIKTAIRESRGIKSFLISLYHI